jgi:hypothetical protein
MNVIRTTMADWMSIGPTVVQHDRVMTVVVTDRGPHLFMHLDRSGNPWATWALAETGHEDPARVPAAIFEELRHTGGTLQLDCGGVTPCYCYPTEDLARGALSDACLAWARLAGGACCQPQTRRCSAVGGARAAAARGWRCRPPTPRTIAGVTCSTPWRCGGAAAVTVASAPRTPARLPTNDVRGRIRAWERHNAPSVTRTSSSCGVPARTRR